MASDDDVKQKEAEVDTLLSKPTTSTIMEDNVTEKESEVAVEEDEKSGKYPWPLLVRTVLLLNAFLALGINDAMGGPTLLDLRYRTYSVVSYCATVIFAGTLLGRP